MVLTGLPVFAATILIASLKAALYLMSESSCDFLAWSLCALACFGERRARFVDCVDEEVESIVTGDMMVDWSSSRSTSVTISILRLCYIAFLAISKL